MVIDMKTKNAFPILLDSYFNTHLKLERKFCDNTYITYLSTIKQFIHYLDFIGIKRKNISFKDFSRRNVLDYLAYEQKEKDCSARTRNHHLSVINSFLEYVQSVNPLYIKQYLEVKSIKHQKENKKIVEFMTVEELNYVLNECNLSSKSGYKHFVMLSLLYETGCRVSELINIKKEDINIGENSYIRVMGKGNKERIIYISNTVVDILISYFKDFHITIDSIFLNHSGQPFTRFGVNKLVMKYTGQASEKCASLKEKTISPHSSAIVRLSTSY